MDVAYHKILISLQHLHSLTINKLPGIYSSCLWLFSDLFILYVLLVACLHVCALRVYSAQRGQKRELDPVWVLGNLVFCWAISSTPSIVFHYFHRRQSLIDWETTCPVFLSEYVGISLYWQASNSSGTDTSLDIFLSSPAETFSTQSCHRFQIRELSLQACPWLFQRLLLVLTYLGWVKWGFLKDILGFVDLIGWPTELRETLTLTAYFILERGFH